MDELPATHETSRRLMHDLRTPLTVVLGRVQLLQRRLKQGTPPESLAPELESIEAALVRLAAAVERLDGER